MAQGPRNRVWREPVINRKTKELDSIKIKYDKASEKDKEQLKVEWYKKLDKFAATMRQLCQE